MKRTENTKIPDPVKLKDQPLSSYKYIAYDKGFNTIEEMAVYFQVDRNELELLIRNKKGSRAKICTGCVKKLREKRFLYHGKEWSVMDIVHLTGLSKAVVEKRVQRGWSIERIIETPVRHKGEYDLTVDGVSYDSIESLADAFRANAVTVAQRLREGKTAKEAVAATKYTHSAGSREVYAFGRVYPSMKALCRDKGVNYHTIMSMKGSHPDTAVETLVSHQLDKPVYKYRVYGKYYTSLKQIAVAYGIRTEALYYKVRDGGDEETLEAIIESEHEREERDGSGKGYKHTVFGIGYPTIAKACAANGVSPQFVYQRKKGGLSVEEAIEYALENGVGLARKPEKASA